MYTFITRVLFYIYMVQKDISGQLEGIVYIDKWYKGRVYSLNLMQSLFTYGLLARHITMFSFL